MRKGTIAAINRGSSGAAIRCDDGRYTLIRFTAASWVPGVGEGVDGELRRLGSSELILGDGTLALVEVESYNCSQKFAKARLTA